MASKAPDGLYTWQIGGMEEPNPVGVESPTLLFRTAGIVAKWPPASPAWTSASVIVFDEADLMSGEPEYAQLFDRALAEVARRQSLKDSVPPLRLVVTTATPSEQMQDLLKTPLAMEIQFHSRQADLEEITLRWPSWQEPYSCGFKMAVDLCRGLQPSSSFAVDLPPTIPASVLVYLPGENEIKEAAEFMESLPSSSPFNSLNIQPFHGACTAAQKREVLRHRLEDGPRIVLANNYADRGVTLPDIIYILDFPGLELSVPSALFRGRLIAIPRG
ncbi:hypothetical protein N9L19_00905 [bacterium]|nr:hypothetical protein [bacterium]